MPDDRGLTHLGDGIPAHLVPVISALLSGATDVTASQYLNYSPRTFSRRVSELLEYLDVQTRFQAGVRLALPDGRPSSALPTILQAAPLLTPHGARPLPRTGLGGVAPVAPRW